MDQQTPNRRYELQAQLVNIAGEGHVAFEPKSNVRLSYPCIRYSQSRGSHAYADDKTYHFEPGYELTLISTNPDEPINAQLIETFPKIRFDRHWVAENLHHWAYIIYN